MPDSVPILTYFQFRGLGEPIRLLLEDLGLPYEDRRVDLFSDAWPKLSPTLPFRQLPRLEIDGLMLFQSQAILRYLARANGLGGETEAERIRCDVGVEAARDLQQRLWDHFWSPGSDTEEAAAAFAAGRLAQELGKLGGWLGDAPFVGGARPLFADYFALTVLDEAGDFFPVALERAPDARAPRHRRLHRLRPAVRVLRLRHHPRHPQPQATGLADARTHPARHRPRPGGVTTLARGPALVRRLDRRRDPAAWRRWPGRGDGARPRAAAVVRLRRRRADADRRLGGVGACFPIELARRRDRGKLAVEFRDQGPDRE